MQNVDARICPEIIEGRTGEKRLGKADGSFTATDWRRRGAVRKYLLDLELTLRGCGRGITRGDDRPNPNRARGRPWRNWPGTASRVRVGPARVSYSRVGLSGLRTGHRVRPRLASGTLRPTFPTACPDHTDRRQNNQPNTYAASRRHWKGSCREKAVRIVRALYLTSVTFRVVPKFSPSTCTTYIPLARSCASSRRSRG